MFCRDAKRMFGVLVGFLESVAGTALSDGYSHARRGARFRKGRRRIAGSDCDCLFRGVAGCDDSLRGMPAGVEPRDVSGIWLRRAMVADGKLLWVILPNRGHWLDAMKTEPFMGWAASPRLMILPVGTTAMSTHLSAPHPARQSFSFR